MSLDVYTFDENNNQFNKLSKDGLQTNPVQTSHDGTNGEIVERKLFLRSDDANFYYTDIQIQGTPARKVRVGDLQFPEAFIGFKIAIQNEQPTRNQWLAIESGNTAVVDDIGDSSTGDTSYKPFWIQVEIPPGTRAQTITDVGPNVLANENPVGV